MSLQTFAQLPEVIPSLDLARCDRCGAAGKFRFLLPAGTDLVFCGHHAHDYGDALTDVHAESWVIGSDPIVTGASLDAPAGGR